jgi:hypothetical protein
MKACLVDIDDKFQMRLNTRRLDVAKGSDTDMEGKRNGEAQPGWRIGQKQDYAVLFNMALSVKFGNGIQIRRD